MRGLLATTAVLGVLAIGGLPVLALTLAVDETGPGREPTTVLEDADGPGGPPWAQGEDREPPPGWVRNHGGATPHGWAVREWAHCRADAARDGRDPLTCGAKPTSPGHLKKAGKASKADKAQVPDEADEAPEAKKPKKPKKSPDGPPD